MKMLKKIAAAAVMMAVVLFIVSGIVLAARSENLYTMKNEETGYYAVIMDSAELLNEEEERKLEEYLDRMTEYCSAIFLTSNETHSSSMHEYSKAMLEKIGKSVDMTDGYNAVIFVVDMDKRQLTIYAGETAAKVITTAISNSITDNTYTYASRGDYYGVARETFTQLYQVLDGQAIAQPMKYITTALLAIFAGLGISLILVRRKTKRKKADVSSVMDALEICRFDPEVTVALIREEKVRHEEASGGGFGGGGGHFGGGGGGFSGGGGGGFSGGGSSGGHGF